MRRRQRVHDLLQIRRPRRPPRPCLRGAARAQHPMLVGPGRDGEIRIRGEAAAPGAQQFLGTVEAQHQLGDRGPQFRYPNSGAQVGELSQVLPDMGFQEPSAWHARRCRDRRPSSPPPAPASRPRRRAPGAPGGTPGRRRGRGRPARPSASAAGCLRSCAFSTSLAVRACRYVMPPAAAGAGSPCSRSVSLTAPTAASGTGRNDGCAPAALHRRIGRLRPTRVRCRCIDRAVGVQHQPARRARLLHRAARDAGMRRVLALAQAGAAPVEGSSALGHRSSRRSSHEPVTLNKAMQ